MTAARRICASLASASILWGTVLAAQADSAPDRGAGPPTPQEKEARIDARAVNIAPPLDSGLDTGAWQTADSIWDFRQRDPLEGAAASERTVVKVLRDHDALYVAVRAWDRDAPKIRAVQLRWDSDLSSDDNITILIDSFHDRRNGFVFQTNPNGAQWDAQITNQDEVNQQWNGIWNVAVHRDSAGWTAIYRIPFRTLRFVSKESAVFGFNVRRFVRRRNEEILWRGWRRTEGLYRLGAEGELGGLGDASRAREFVVKPYALVNASQAPHDSIGDQIGDGGVSGKAGVDAKLAVSATLTADLTINTDFSQVEVDSQVINLTRFPTFFPEKRDFFLESSGIFDFGFNQRALMFYSRRIGLTDSGEVVPIIAGARFYGKAGAWTLGALDARTGGIDQANYATVRIKHDLLDRSYVGGIVTARTGPGVNGSELAGGLDADFPLVVGGQNIEPTMWVAATHSSALGGEYVAWRVATDFPNDLFDNFVALARYDSAFSPPLGFVLRTGVWETYGHIDYTPRPHLLGIRQFIFELPSWDIYANANGSLTDSRDWQTATIQATPLGASFENGDEFQVQIQRAMDAPPDSFEVFRGVTIPAGRYWWTRGGIQYQSSLGRPVSVFVLLFTGGFYDGHSTETDAAITWRTGGHLIVGGGISRTEAQLPAGHFVAAQATGRLEVAFTTRIDFLGFAQFDNELDRADFDLRFHWIPVIGDDVYVVWNSGYTTDPLSRYRFPDAGALHRPLNATLTIKATHRFAL